MGVVVVMVLVLVVELDVLLEVDAPNGLDAVTDWARIRCLLEVGSLIEQAGNLREELSEQQV